MFFALLFALKPFLFITRSGPITCDRRDVIGLQNMPVIGFGVTWKTVTRARLFLTGIACKSLAQVISQPVCKTLFIKDSGGQVHDHLVNILRRRR